MNDQDALQAIADQFNKTAQQTAAGLIIILSFVFLVLLIFLIYAGIKRRKLFKSYKVKYENLVLEFELSHPEIELIEKLSRFLKTQQKKYILLLNQHTFFSCLWEYEKQNPQSPVPPEFVKALCIKLDFRQSDLFHFPAATWDIREGKPAVLLLPDKKKIPGIITKQYSDSIVFTISDNSPLPLPGTDATIYMHYSLGIYYFQTIVKSTEEKKIFLMHSDTITQIQRREYYRKKLFLPVLIRKEGHPEESYSSVILDLSAGGMSVNNVQNKFKKGDDCRFFFHDKAETEYQLYGEVIRTSKNGKILHIRFGHLPASVKNQINSFLKA